MPFKNRWRIDGTLTTRSPLHIGSGGVTTRKELVANRRDSDGKKSLIQIAAVATDYQQRAYIPGKALKGVLRSWLTERKGGDALIESVFGSAETGGNIEAFGGKAEFCDAFANAPAAMPQAPYACAKRLTGVAASVAIKRQTRTAYPTKLFHQEFVPPGIAFEVTITGQDLELEERQLLLYVLEQFNHEDQPVVIGAETGDGFGRLSWTLRDIAYLDATNMDDWLEGSNTLVGYAGYPALAAEERHQLVTDAKSAFQAALPATLTLGLAIHFDGPFLVNDPSQFKVKGDPDHNPLRDHLGRILLPASSIRGAVRSQAERIVRTLAQDPEKSLELACHATDPKTACEPLDVASKRHEELCLTCQVFGAPGWRSPVSFSDFVSDDTRPDIPFHQEFLAIDRFTGGGADGLKFNAEAVYQPMLSGQMTIDLQRLDLWALGLLALLLRDLIEGDIVLGFGAAKGYGACRAEVTGLHVMGLENCPGLWDILQTCEAAQIDWNGFELAALPTLELEYIAIEDVLKELLNAFREKLNPVARGTS
jgi:CRISPR/Cas system CSM-associated protein Csm3 (group 7 of RAMP superfamily)